ncbi:MAG: ATP-dependent Clp protease ATP-binding subunit ClpX [Capsulimonadaceae bacterium]
MKATCLVCEENFEIERDRGQVIEVDYVQRYVCRRDWPGFNAGAELQRRVMESERSALREQTGRRQTEQRSALTAYKMSPRDIVRKLDEYVIGQARAKRDVAIALYDHHRIHQVDIAHLAGGTTPDVDLEKANILLVGPSGSGKTLIARTLARSLGVPFASSDATSLSPTGYTGNDVESVLTPLYIDAAEDLDWAGRGVVFLDEVDKIARKSMANPSITRDVSGESVQHALLKLVEGTLAQLPLGASGRKHPDAPPEFIDTTKILFIGGGAFEGFPEIVAKKMHRQTERTMGLRANPSAVMGDPQRDYEILAEASPEVMIESMIEYGFVPEFAGRFPIIVPLAPLTQPEMRRALTEPKNAVVRQQIELFARDGIELVIEDEALDLIVSRAVSMKTGVRALRSLVKQMTSQARFDQSGDSTVARIEIGPECLDEPERYRMTRRSVAAVKTDEGAAGMSVNGEGTMKQAV